MKIKHLTTQQKEHISALTDEWKQNIFKSKDSFNVGFKRSIEKAAQRRAELLIILGRCGDSPVDPQLYDQILVALNVNVILKTWKANALRYHFMYLIHQVLPMSDDMLLEAASHRFSFKEINTFNFFAQDSIVVQIPYHEYSSINNARNVIAESKDTLIINEVIKNTIRSIGARKIIIETLLDNIDLDDEGTLDHITAWQLSILDRVPSSEIDFMEDKRFLNLYLSPQNRNYINQLF
jgi:hypothetical protein